MALNETNPRPGDTEPELLRKILTLLGGLFSPGDTTEKITAKIVLALQAALNVPNAEELVWLTLSQLEKTHLLAEAVVKPAHRKVLRRCCRWCIRLWHQHQ